jgi:protein disulfide-isomerase
MGDVLEGLPQEYFLAARRLEPAHATELERQVDVVMDQLAADPRYSTPTQLFALMQQIAAAQALEPAGKAPQAMADRARQHADLVLSQVHEPYARTAAVNAVLNLWEQLGDRDRSYSLLIGELKSSATPYYYMSDLGDLEEERGHPDAAIDWFARSYQGSRGQATRTQWGSRYVRALIRLRPGDATTIRTTTLQLLQESAGNDPEHGRNRIALDQLFVQLHRWGMGAAHAPALGEIRTAAEQMCRRAQPVQSAASSCAQLVAKI